MSSLQEPMCLLDVKGSEFVLNLDELEEALRRLGWLDKKVAFVPVCGEFRRGKSFLLNFFLRFLRHLKHNGSITSSGDWLRSSTGDGTVADGFPFRGGHQRHTIGICCWPEPFLLKQPNGDEVVVLICDSQGLFDNLSGGAVNQMLFVLSAIISSTMIYNISENIDKNDWDLLSRFVNFAKAVNFESGNGQKMEGKLIETLVILVRDWNDPELAFGYGGGNEYLREEMEEAGLSEDIQQGRRAVRDVCDVLYSFLMPHPGSKVASDQFQGDMKDISPVFLDQLRVLVPSLLSPANIRPKHFNGQPLTCAAWISMFKTYAAIFKTGVLPPEKAILTATAESTQTIALHNSVGIYRQQMDAYFVGNEPLSDGQLSAANERCKTEAIGHFNLAKKLSTGPSMDEDFLANLNTVIAKLFTDEIRPKNATLRQTEGKNEESAFHKERKNLEEEKRNWARRQQENAAHQADGISHERATRTNAHDKQMGDADEEISREGQRQNAATEANQKTMAEFTNAIQKNTEQMDGMQRDMRNMRQQLKSGGLFKRICIGVVGGIATGIAAITPGGQAAIPMIVASTSAAAAAPDSDDDKD